MKYIKGQNRSQTYLFPVSLDDAIDADNEVRLIDVFVDSLALEDYGFQIDHGENGRPAYHPGDLLKLFIYGYMNKIRSSRRLERECKRNIEVMWLVGNLQPDHNTISNFRRDNPKAIKKVFRETVKIANYFNLLGATLIAGDSTKFRAQNSKKNNFNEKKISRHLEYIENKLQEYNQALAQSDGDKEEIKEQIEQQKKRADGYREIETQLKESGEPQVSTSDLDSRQMIIPNQTVHAPDPAYDAENFTYVPEGDYYICPQNQHLTTTGKWHQASAYCFKRYATRACKSCSVKKQCSKATYGKGIHRSEYHEYIEHNKEHVELNKALYKRRQAIVEHPYGTLKRQWGFSYIMTKKSMKRASADVGLMMTAYNLRRIINILGVECFRRYLEDLIDRLLSKTGLLNRIPAYVLAFFDKRKNWKVDFILPVYRLSLINI